MSDAQQHIQRTQRLPDVEGADNDAQPNRQYHREQTEVFKAPRRDSAPLRRANQQQNKRADRALGKDRKRPAVTYAWRTSLNKLRLRLPYRPRGSLLSDAV